MIERLLEHPLEGTFTFRGADGPRRIEVRAKADRIDLLEGGGLRDHRLQAQSRAESGAGAAAADLRRLRPAEPRGAARPIVDRRQRRLHRLQGEERVRAAGLVDVAGRRRSRKGEKRLVAAVDGIERGEFPVKPDEPFLCTRCGYAGVCRKDYIGDE